jgi:hypothetical protein
MNASNNIADRNTIASFFGFDELDTHNVLKNCNFGFFRTHFGDDAEKKWSEAHPFFYPGDVYRDFTSFDLDFVKNHIDLFLNKRFYTQSGWEFNEKTNKMEFTYKSGYINR